MQFSQNKVLQESNFDPLKFAENIVMILARDDFLGIDEAMKIILRN
jgi:hypothetical protein